MMRVFLSKLSAVACFGGAALLTAAVEPAIAARVQWKVATGGNGHWYEFVYSPAGFTWEQAWAAAANTACLGLPAYLATVTSQAENNFVYGIAKYPAGATGTKFNPANPGVSLGPVDISGRDALTWLAGSDAATEGTWRWVDGPETATVFWTGDGITGSAPAGTFNSWDNPSTPGGTTGSEPNDAGSGNFLQLGYAGSRWVDTNGSAMQVLPGFNADGVTRVRAPVAYVVECSSDDVRNATFTVTNTNDNGTGSLRDAIIQANRAQGSKTITFAPGVAGTILLTSGELQIDTGPLTIVGPGADILTIDGNASDRIFNIFESDPPACPAPTGPRDFLVTISGLTLANAHRNTDHSGGAIASAKSLLLDSVIIRDSMAKNGGAVALFTQYQLQRLSIANSQFINNVAKPLSATTGAENAGGALYLAERCPAVRTIDVEFFISNSAFTGNRVQPTTLNGYGGAIGAFVGIQEGFIFNTRIVGNGVDVPTPPVAGRLYRGGGGYFDSRIPLTGFPPEVKIEGSEITENAAGEGGGLGLINTLADTQLPDYALLFTIVNSTISGNVASTTGGAAMAIGNVSVELDNSTISNNAAPLLQTGGIVIGTESGATPPSLRLNSSIVANSLVAANDLATTPLIFALTVESTKSLIGTICRPPACSIVINGTGNLIAVDPLLGPLASNGGSTRTHAPLSGSPVINGGFNPLGLANDQRGTGFPRVAGAAADMGAYELTSGIAPFLQSASSRKAHGSAGTFDLSLSLVSTNPTIEPRQGPSQTIVFTFDRPLIAGMAQVTEGSATAGAPTFGGNEMRVPLTSVANQQYVTVAVSDVSSADGGTGGTGSIRLGFLLGDVTQNRVVTLSDMGQVNAQIAQFVTSANFLKDVNASGTLSLADKGIVNTQTTKALPSP